MSVRIIGTGSALPERRVANEELSLLVDTSDEWIRERTGIGSRHVSTKETVASLAASACGMALERAGRRAEEVELLLVATCSPEDVLPCAACQVQEKIGAVNAVAFDLNAACAGFLFALHTAWAYIEAGIYQNALIAGSEVLSKIVDWQDRGTCVLFGDGAGAVLVEKCGTGGILGFVQHSDGRRGSVLSCAGRQLANPYIAPEASDGGQASPCIAAEASDGGQASPCIAPEASDGGQASPCITAEASDGRQANAYTTPEVSDGGQANPCTAPEPPRERRDGVSPGGGQGKPPAPPTGYVQMDGREVFAFAVRQVPAAIGEALEKARLKVEDVDLFVLHQANRRIIEGIAKRLGAELSRFPMNLERVGNTSSAAIPLLLDELDRQGRLARGSIIVLSGFGAGLTYGACVMKW